MTTWIEQYQAAAEALVAEATGAGLTRIAAAARTPLCDPRSAGLTCTDSLVTGFAAAPGAARSSAEVERVLGVARAAPRGETPSPSSGSRWWRC